MPFLESILISTRNLISDIGGRDDGGSEENDLTDDSLSPIHESDNKEKEAAPRTLEQLETAISRTKAKFQDVKAAGKQSTVDQRQEIRTLKSEMRQQEVHLKKRQRAAYDIPYDDYGKFMHHLSPKDGIDAPETQEDVPVPVVEPNSDAAAGPTLSQSMEQKLGTMLEAQLLKHLHLLMVAEQQLQIQSNIWNDIVLTLHEKPGSLDEDFMGTKLKILTEISTTEKTKSQMEQQGESQVRKQVISMSKLKREVAREVKKKTSQLEDKVFKNGEEDTPTMQLIRSLSSDTFNSTDLHSVGEDDPVSPDVVPPMPLLRQTSSAKLRLAREKASARLAQSKNRFKSDTTISITSDVISLEAIKERKERSDIPVETKLEDEEDDRRLSPLGVNEFPSQEGEASGSL
ncbi:MAG: hypothetical protein SGBAC_005207 [Bacillariaceae sp.]